MPLFPSSLLDAALAPAPDPARVASLNSVPFAHRGLHGNGVPENSRAAFRAAIERGHGIELDVQPSREGEAMVFHDAGLRRMTGEDGLVGLRLRPDLQKLRLLGSAEVLPTLTEILALIRGRVPLLIEIKASGRHVSQICTAVARSLEDYRGPVGVMSFNPAVGRWFARYAPEVVRGLVMSEAEGPWHGRLSRHFALWGAKPDFLAYDVRSLPSRFAAAQRKRGLPVFTWTCRGTLHHKAASLHADQPIYEEDEFESSVVVDV